MNANALKQVRILGQLTGNRFDVMNLAGDHHSTARAALMAGLLGLAKCPKSKAGVNALQAEFYRQCGPIEGDCIWARENSFRAICRAALEPVTC